MSYTLAFFQESGGGFGLFGAILPFLLIFAIFYFLVILPQKRQRQQLQELIESLKINDEIVTNGGVIGKIKEVRGTSFIILSADKSMIEIGRSAVVGKRAE